MNLRFSMAVVTVAIASAMWAPMTMGQMTGMAGPADQARERGQHKQIVWTQARAALKTSQHEGRVRGPVVTFHGKTVAITLIANAPHHPDMSFEAGGLTNPTISVAQGARVTLTFLNMDYGPYMDHGVVITATKPPYPARMGHRLTGVLAHIWQLPPRSQARLAQARYTETSVQFVPRHSGTYFYVCPTPGHALAYRMYGRFLVRHTS
ncbi:MAG: cupredoxin domain-containing protein [Acidiferrobacter sp.]